jgi:hydrogenase expression/formation protein HypC
MCLGVPGRLVERLPEVDGLAHGVIEFAGVRRQACLACVPDAAVGDHVVVHAGLAISRLDAGEAERLLAHLRETGQEGDADEVP